MTPETPSELPPAKVYLVVATTPTGEVASRGYVLPPRVSQAKRLFGAEGWTVEVTPVADADIPPHIAQQLS